MNTGSELLRAGPSTQTKHGRGPRARSLPAFAAAIVPAPAAIEAQIADDVEPRVRAVHAAAEPLDAHADVLVSTTPDIYRTEEGESQLTPEKLSIMPATTHSRTPRGPQLRVTSRTAACRRSAAGP